jgi:smad nuclear-interacting protein 1
MNFISVFGFNFQSLSKKMSEVRKHRHNHKDIKGDSSPPRHRRKESSRDRSPARKDDRRFNRNDDRRDRRPNFQNRKFDNRSKNEEKWGKPTVKEEPGETSAEEKKKPDFGLSGKLTEDTNTFKGVVIKYSEPPEARKPKRRWRLYVFKGQESLPFIEIHRQSAFLLGKDRKVADIPIDHPSCSKQHAALQFRSVTYTRDDGRLGRRIRPYIMDLDSSNGTYVNNNRIPSRCYFELLEKDMIKFGYSSREYIVLHSESQDDDGSDLDEDTTGNDDKAKEEGTKKKKEKTDSK